MGDYSIADWKIKSGFIELAPASTRFGGHCVEDDLAVLAIIGLLLAHQNAQPLETPKILMLP